MSEPRRILVADDISAAGIDILGRAGEVTVQRGMDEDRLREALPPYHALVVRSATKVTARALEGAERLAVIGRAGIGVDNIDVDAATARGIVVMNTPEAGATTTAEHAIALLLSLARNIPAADASMKRGAWEKSKFLGVEITGKTALVVGLGRIGRVVAERLLGLRCVVIAHDPYLTQAQAPAGVRLVELREGLAEADFVTVHVPLSEATRNLLDADRIGAMKRGARLVHAARGGIVDEAALAEALADGRLAGAALDVFATEPLPADHPLRRLDNAVLTPHLGASTVEAKENVSLDVARQVVECLRTGIALNGVNVPAVSPSAARTVGPFLNLAHNLAAFLSQVVDAGPVESLRVTLQGALAEQAAEPILVSAITGALAARIEQPITPVNARRLASEIGLRTFVEASSMKRDFMNLVRIEMLVGGRRRSASGTVLGQRHGRLVQFDDYLIDAIPEGPLLVTFHHDAPGVLGQLGTLLGEHGVNISRMQLGTPEGGGEALGIFNLDNALTDRTLAAVRAIPAVRHACSVL